MTPKAGDFGLRIAARAARGGSRSDLLGLYLNDHYAGATTGTELARRLAAAHRGSAFEEELERLRAEIAEDRESLASIMTRLNVPIRRYKACAGWASEKVARLKFNGYLLGRSPLSSVLELESLRLGVEGKASGWQTLRTLADREERLDAPWLDELLDRARRQSQTLNQLRIQQARKIFTGP